MAAGQQKKRLVNSSSQEHYKGKKKKKVDTPDYVLNVSARIHLQWDDLQKSVVAKREQIGITWANMAPFVESLPQNRKDIADVLSIPKEIFDLKDLMDVLSYEAWGTCLSESERKLLTQFLPGGTCPEQTVHSLLTGKNYHFGNPFLQWSTSLCSGRLHPNAVLKKDRKIRTIKKQYYSELNKFHKDMLGGLVSWKEKWSSCKDPEQLWSKGVSKQRQGVLSICTERAKFSPIAKKETPNKTYICNGDLANHMSYIKITKKQHEAIKNLRHSGDGIQTKSLSRVLGDIKGFHVLPFEALVEEEKTRLHEHWLQVVQKDLPVVFEANQKEKLQRKQLKKCLYQEFAEKRAMKLDKTETDSQESSPRERIVDGEHEYQSVEIIEEDVASAPAGLSHYGQTIHVPSLKCQQEPRSTASDQIVTGDDSLSSAQCPPVISQFSRTISLVEFDGEPKASTFPPKDIWRTVDSKGCKFSTALSQSQSRPIEEYRAPVINVERDFMVQGSGESDGVSLFSSYTPRSEDNLLPPFPNGPELLSYAPHEQTNHIKQPELQFLMGNDHLSEPSQQSLIEHSREKELYMHQMMTKSVYSNGRYQNQEICSSGNDGLVSQNWFPGNLRTHSNYWCGVVPSSSGSQSLGGNTDGTL